MAGPGGGPSRRSHTKSRKGCKTCKRRHIRCDETFPQCRNCTKHQVRCDYMDSPTASPDDHSGAAGQANLLWNPEIEAAVDLWRRTGEYPFPELNVYPQPQWHAYSRVDLRLIYHISTVSSELSRHQVSRLTLWTEQMPKFLSIAAQHPFVMHSILAFSASHLAWISQSQETRNLAYQHGAVALKGLQIAIANFSKTNSDAVLAASLLLSWQAHDWRTWASVMTGSRTIINAMQQWKQESILSEFLTEHAQSFNQSLVTTATYQITQDARREHLAILHHVHSSLTRIQPYLGNHDSENKWVEQLKGYIDRLRVSTPPQSAEEQFSQLYALRKWLFWVPITLLSHRKGDPMMLLVLAHFYATALALEPIFTDIGAAFCGDMALTAMDEVTRMLGQMQATQPQYNQGIQTATLLLEFPRETASIYKSRRDWARQQSQELQVLQSPFAIENLHLSLDLDSHVTDFGLNTALSPAFPPSPLHFTQNVLSPAGPKSPYLDVPHISMSSAYTSPLASPAPISAFSQEDYVSNYGMATMPMGYHGGFVAPPPTVWT